MSWNNRVGMPRPLPERRFLKIQPEPRLAHLRVRPMPAEAVAGQNWLHVLVEIKMLRSPHTRLPVVTAQHHPKQCPGKKKHRLVSSYLIENKLIIIACRQLDSAPFSVFRYRLPTSVLELSSCRFHSRLLACFHYPEQPASSAQEARPVPEFDCCKHFIR